ncbi:MAG: hypothetical protein RBU37_18080 [Myxococcota bacterium]|jgi:hypothetical protein|nr:hypothetical protein [Myxococcota bacterium]
MSTVITPGSLLMDDIEVVSLMSERPGVQRFIAMHPKQRGHMLVHVLTQACDDEKRSTALRELEQASLLKHVALPPRFGVGRVGEQVYLVEAMPVGELLSEALAEGRRPELPYVVKRLLDLLDVLLVAHDAGCWHGGLDPDCILLERAESRSEHLLVLGLGVAQAMRTCGAGLLSERRFVPADAIERGHPEPKDDVFSVAAMTLAMIAGFDALDRYAGALPNELRSHPLGELLDRALNIDPKKRFASIAAFRDAAQVLRRLLAPLESKGSVEAEDYDGFSASLSTVLGGMDDALGDVPEARGDEDWLKLLPSSGGAKVGALASLEAELAFSGLRDDAVRQLLGEESEERDDECTTVSGPPEDSASGRKKSGEQAERLIDKKSGEQAERPIDKKSAERPIDKKSGEQDKRPIDMKSGEQAKRPIDEKPEITVRTGMGAAQKVKTKAASPEPKAPEEVTAKTGAGLLKKGKKKKKKDESSMPGAGGKGSKTRPLGLRPEVSEPSSNADEQEKALAAVAAQMLEMGELVASKANNEEEERTLIGPPPTHPSEDESVSTDERELEALTTSELPISEAAEVKALAQDDDNETERDQETEGDDFAAKESAQQLDGTGQAPNRQEVGGTGQAPNRQEVGGTGQAPNRQEVGGTGQAPNRQEVGGTGQAPNQQEEDSFEEFAAPELGRSDPLPTNEVRTCAHTLRPDSFQEPEPEEDFEEEPVLDGSSRPVQVRPPSIQPLLMKVMVAAIVVLALLAIYLWATLEPKPATQTEQSEEPDVAPSPIAPADDATELSDTAIPAASEPDAKSSADAARDVASERPVEPAISDDAKNDEKVPPKDEREHSDDSSKPPKDKKKPTTKPTVDAVPSEPPELLNIKID